jgi:prepilin-type N-terminal cleavage/methylation domain-containing protein
MRKHKKGGFTLIELLVVIAIIGVLVALLLPAVQAAREAARRSQCANNMKQLGVAISSYHAHFQLYPTITVNVDPFSSPGTWMTMILPFFEQEQTYNSFNFGAGPDLCASNYFVYANKTAARTAISTFVCPSDATNKPKDYSMGIPPFSGQTLTNYGGIFYPVWSLVNNQLLWGPFKYWREPFTYPGTPLFKHDPVAAGDILDGTANTLFALEMRADVPFPNADANGRAHPLWYLNSPIYYIVYQDCAYLNTASPFFWGPYNLPRYGINLPLTGVAETYFPPFKAAGSYHQGGCQGLTLDGRVIYITENVDFRLLLARASTGQGETISSDGEL